MGIGEWIGGWAEDRLHDAGSLVGVSEGSNYYQRLKRSRQATLDGDYEGAASELQGLNAQTDEGRSWLRSQRQAVKTGSNKEAEGRQNQAFETMYGKPAPGKGYIQELQDRQTATQTALQRQQIEAQKELTRMSTGSNERISNTQSQAQQNIANTQAQAQKDSTNIAGKWGNEQANTTGAWGFASTDRSALAQENSTDMSTGRQLLGQLDANNVQREVAEKQHKLGRMELLGNMYLQSKAGNQNFILGAGARKAGF